MPLVSVLLPVYNALPDLSRALRSLLAQTFVDFEIIAIDDGSTDGSGELLENFAKQDARLRVFHQPNAGALGKVLNRAAELAQGKYLARQDADDASSPIRLEKQVAYLNANPETGLCGTWTWFIDHELGPLFSLELPDDHALLTRYLLKKMNPLTHGSVMFRADIFQKVGGYRGSYAEDFDLWVRMSENSRLGICKTLGYYYWRSVGGISYGSDLRQQALLQLILKLHFERIQLGHEVSSWNTEYQKILELPTGESNPVERQTLLHYARGVQLLRRKDFMNARNNFQKASAGKGPYAVKAHRNLSLFWFPPALTALYWFMLRGEPEFYARQLSQGTPLPEF
jgi:glycosyltransferase involved in cell wall biosynthesis